MPDSIESAHKAPEETVAETYGTETEVAPGTPAQQLLARLLSAHEVWFDVERDYAYAGRTFPGFAAFHEYGEQYVLSKRAKLWSAEQHEYIFFDIVDRLEESVFLDYVEFMKTEAIKLVQPQPDHMSTNLTLVIIADSASEEATKAAKHVKYRKNFKMGLQGWSDLKVALVNLSADPKTQITTNAAGKMLKETISANMKLQRK